MLFRSRADRWYSRIAFWLVAALVFFPPLYRGLFFDSDMFVYHTITAVFLGLFWLDKINRGDYEFFKTPLDFIILGYVIIYALTNMVAVDRGIALYTSLRIVNYFMVYWLVYQALRDFKDYKNILHTSCPHDDEERRQKRIEYGRKNFCAVYYGSMIEIGRASCRERV